MQERMSTKKKEYRSCVITSITLLEFWGRMVIAIDINNKCTSIAVSHHIGSTLPHRPNYSTLRDKRSFGIFSWLIENYVPIFFFFFRKTEESTEFHQIHTKRQDISLKKKWKIHSASVKWFVIYYYISLL